MLRFWIRRHWIPPMFPSKIQSCIGWYYFVTFLICLNLPNWMWVSLFPYTICFRWYSFIPTFVFYKWCVKWVGLLLWREKCKTLGQTLGDGLICYRLICQWLVPKPIGRYLQKRGWKAVFEWVDDLLFNPDCIWIKFHLIKVKNIKLNFLIFFFFFPFASKEKKTKKALEYSNILLLNNQRRTRIKGSSGSYSYSYIGDKKSLSPVYVVTHSLITIYLRTLIEFYR